ncbi:MAG: phosphoenolpyruvate carboxykinase (ATP) [Patescibacteria group bacterium]|nr:phosphoenolpyruvate carboxykinase (ATP) [Patescibacteria group bacterium]
MDKVNLTFTALFKEETRAGLEGWEKGVVTNFGAVSVDTGRFTGRSPEDKYFVAGGPAGAKIWWRDGENPTSPNKPLSIESWDYLFDLVKHQLKDKDLYVMDGFLGARQSLSIKVRLKTEIAWQAHFFKNMFIRPTAMELAKFEPEWTILSASKVIAADWEKYGLNSEVFAAINLEKRVIIIGGTWYGGEIKKGMFSVANYVLPLKGVGSFHCSANQGIKGDTVLFFGLSGTGKTTLSADPQRRLIGDDEHGWDEKGIFNLEGGCYAKVINLSKEKEPDIYGAIKKDALLENVVVDKKGKIDFGATTKTENTRVSYPINHIRRIVRPWSVGDHPQVIIFLTCDSFGVLPPVAKLNDKEAMYWYLTGYTAKVAGTERGVLEPKATFSACFGQPFLSLQPKIYAKILREKIVQHKAKVYLINTGWTGGGYGVGKRIDLGVTREIVNQILTGKLARADYERMKPFDLLIPKKVSGIESEILRPRNTWTDKQTYDEKALELMKMFKQNYKKYE